MKIPSPRKCRACPPVPITTAERPAKASAVKRPTTSRIKPKRPTDRFHFAVGQNHRNALALSGVAKDLPGPLLEEPAGTVLALLHNLGITPSHSRPRLSNDNAHAEAFFPTAKYHPSTVPKGFETLQSARQWAASFINWYNQGHKHRSLKHVTPHQKHTGEDHQILAPNHLPGAERSANLPVRKNGAGRSKFL